MENRKRNERLNLRFSEEERDALYKMKEKGGYKTLVDMVTAAVNGRKIVKINTAPLLGILGELSRIMVNIRQIERVAQQCGTRNRLFAEMKQDIMELTEFVQKKLDLLEAAKKGEFDGLYKDYADKRPAACIDADAAEKCGQ